MSRYQNIHSQNLYKGSNRNFFFIILLALTFIPSSVIAAETLKDLPTIKDFTAPFSSDEKLTGEGHRRFQEWIRFRDMFTGLVLTFAKSDFGAILSMSHADETAADAAIAALDHYIKKQQVLYTALSFLTAGTAYAIVCLCKISGTNISVLVQLKNK